MLECLNPPVVACITQCSLCLSLANIFLRFQQLCTIVVAVVVVVLSVLLLFVSLWSSQCVVLTLQPAVQAPPPPFPLHSPMSCDVVFSNQSGVLKHNTLTLGMLCQGGGHGQGHSNTLNFNLYNNTKHEPPAGRWLPLPPPPSANAVSIPLRTMNPWYCCHWCTHSCHCLFSQLQLNYYLTLNHITIKI